MRHHPAVARTRSAVTACLADVDAGDLVLTAVSGGADSLALAAALAHAGRRRAIRTGALVVDHRLQPDSADVAAAASATCRSLELDPVCVETVTVGTRGGPEASAREARYAALDAAAERLGAVAVLLGHTLDDQAETVLLRLARGSGARSLAGMPERFGRYRRPFLAVRRDETRAACTALGLAFWDDPHNGDPGFARARVRDRLMPLLEETLGPGVAQALARTAALLRDDADALDQWADGAGDLAVASLARLPRAVRTRVLRRTAVAAGAPAGALSAGHVRALERLVTDWHGQGPVTLPGGLVAARACDRLTFR